MKHLKCYRFQSKPTKTHHQAHLKTPQKHTGTPQNTSNHYKHQPETLQNTSNRIEMLDFVANANKLATMHTQFNTHSKMHSHT